jgi:cytochrome P450
MQLEATGISDGSALPLLPVESPEFWADPERFVAPARGQHPWLARFSQGYVVHGCQANKDLLADSEHLYMGLDGIVEFYGAQGTLWAGFMNEMLNSQRGQEHARIRNSVAMAFTPRRANQIRPLMRRVITELLDEWAPRGQFDFAEFASFFPVAVMCGLLGVSAEPIPRLRKALEAQLASLTLNPAVKPDFLAGFDVMWQFTDELVNRRESSGLVEADSLLDAMIAAKAARRLNDRELRFLIMVLLFAGYDTSKNMLTMTMHLLLERPAMYVRCADDQAFCALVVEEALRHSGIATAFRQVKTSFVYGGFRFPQGALVAMATPLGGRDPAAFVDPLAFNPERQADTRHVAFGRGPHMCIGQFLARNQLQEGLHLIAQRLRNIRRVGDVTWRPFLGAWGLRTLPLAFDAA